VVDVGFWKCGKTDKPYVVLGEFYVLIWLLLCATIAKHQDDVLMSCKTHLYNM
jgi:hypothetical protein